MYNSFFSPSSTSIPSNPLYLQALRSHLLPLSFRTIRYTPYTIYCAAQNVINEFYLCFYSSLAIFLTGGQLININCK